MNKQTFPIPDGCKAITMEIIDNTIVTTFEPQFKRGDVLISIDGHICVLDEIINEYRAVEIVGIIKGEITYAQKPMYFDCIQRLRLATPEEAQRLWDALAKEGKRWNPETMEVEEIKKEIPRAKVFKDYYFIECNPCRVIKSCETKELADDDRHRFGNYFLSEGQAQRAADRLKAELDKFWKEELK